MHTSACTTFVTSLLAQVCRFPRTSLAGSHLYWIMQLPFLQ